MTLLALNAAPFVAMATPKVRVLHQWMRRLMHGIAESRMRRVERELERHGFSPRPDKTGR